MVALELQHDLAKEIQGIFEQRRFKAPGGAQVTLNVYEQNLPMRDVRQMREQIQQEDEAELDEVPEEDGDEELNDLFPYCVVKLDQGVSESPESTHDVSTKIIIGIYDDALSAEGYKDILNMIENIRRRFRVNPVLNGRYVVKDKIEWALPDDDRDTFPYFFGALYLEWQTVEYEREDELA